MAWIVDQIVQLRTLVGVQHVHGLAHGQANSRVCCRRPAGPALLLTHGGASPDHGASRDAAAVH